VEEFLDQIAVDPELELLVMGLFLGQIAVDPELELLMMGLFLGHQMVIGQKWVRQSVDMRPR
jgi:hypothetical protein